MTDFSENTSTITLANPVSSHFQAFIFGNSTMCDRVAQHESHKGQHVVICGAGPSLRENVELTATGDEVWACNSALTWLHDNGHRVTHGLTVDQTPSMLTEWESAPDVEYLLASSVHPHLTEALTKKGRRLTFFHNYVGLDMPPVSYDGVTASYEDWFYALLYPPTVRVGSGLNAVTRAIDLAEFMGFETITVLGADCAIRTTAPMPEGATIGSPAHTTWLEQHTIMHADGGNAIASGATPVTLSGTIDGRLWVSKPDMLITSVFLVKMKRRLGDRLQIIGDTLPAALMDKPDSYLEKLPSLTDSAGKRLNIG
jgi:hypothetical protein